MAKEYFCAYHSYAEALTAYGDAEKGRLFMACLTYSKTGVEPQLNGNERFIWPMLKQNIDRDNEKYNEICLRNRANGSGRGRSVAVGSETSQEEEKEKDKDEEKENIKEMVDQRLPQVRLGKDRLGEDRINKYSDVPELDDAIEEFIAFRKRIRKPMTDKAIDLLLSKLSKLSGDPKEQIEIINQSILNGWAGVFPLKGGEQHGQHNQQDTSKWSDLGTVL